jgi:hypothetical protein
VLELPGLRIFETGGDRYEAEREQCNDCNSVLPIARGVVVAYERNVDTKPLPTPCRRRGDHDRRPGAAQGGDPPSGMSRVAAVPGLRSRTTERRQPERDSLHASEGTT